MNVCENWKKNKLVNPSTGRKIVENGPTYRLLEKKCGAKQQKKGQKASPIQPKIKKASPIQPKIKKASPIQPKNNANIQPKIKAKPRQDKTSEVLDMVMNGYLDLDPCTLIDKKGTIKTIQKTLLKHETASPTENIKVILNLTDGNNVTVFLKIWPNVYDFNKKAIEYAGVEFEREMYKFITKNILLTKQSPNFIPFLGYSTCPLKTTKYDIKKDFSFKYLTTQIANHPNVFLNVLITGSSANIVSLYDFGEKVKDTQEIASIIFQLSHALYCLKKHNINHLDLHLGNVLIEYMDEPLVLQYITNGLSVTFKTRCMVKIFDFDQANSGFRFNELHLDKFFREVSAYPFNKNEDRDFYQIICSLLQLKNSTITQQVQNAFINTKLSLSEVKKLGELMNFTTDDKFEFFVSAQTARKIETSFQEVVAYRKNNKNMYEPNVYDAPLQELQNILLPEEWRELKKFPNLPIMKSCMFELKNKNKKNIFSVNQGWY